jgi:hypothetical protein
MEPALFAFNGVELRKIARFTLLRFNDLQSFRYLFVQIFLSARMRRYPKFGVSIDLTEHLYSHNEILMI